MEKTDHDKLIVLIQSVEDFHVYTKEQLSRILEQTTKTNGNVTKLKAWKNYTAGAIAVIIIVGGFLVPWMINSILQTEKVLATHSLINK